MANSPKENDEKKKALKKLMTKWLSVQGTQGKAKLVLSKNPEIKHQKKKNRDS